MTELDALELERFEADMCAHLASYDPLLCGVAGAERVREAVVRGTERALSRGLTLRGPIRTYLEIAFTLGCEVDQDPQYAWLGRWLANDGHPSEMERAGLLRFHVERYLRHIQGEDGTAGIDALERAQRVTLEGLREVGARYEEAPAWLASLHPGKGAFIGEAALRGLALDARRQAEESRLTAPEAAPLLLGLMFTFGRGVLRDPLYSWVSHTLPGDEHPSSSGQVEERLVRRAKIYMGQMLAHLQAMKSHV